MPTPPCGREGKRYDDVRELLANFRYRLMEDDLISSLGAAIDFARPA
jgi:nitrate/nitrite-specific signal transduction histidine kinase